MLERASEEHSSDRAYRERGYHGGALGHHTKDEIAKIHRTRAGRVDPTVPMSQQHRDFATVPHERGTKRMPRPHHPWPQPQRQGRSQVFFTSTRPHFPWKSRTGSRKTKKIAAAAPKPFDLRGVVARFKRSGDLPNVPIDTVRAAPADGVDGRALKRMISAMLLKAGVEPNPGPPKFDISGNPVCPYTGKRVQGERVLVKGHWILVCPACPAKLTDVQGKIGLHPGEKDTADIEVIAAPPKPVERPATLIPSPLVPPTLHNTPATKQIVAPAPAPVSRPTPVEHPLAGHRISDEDRVAIMSRLVGTEIDVDQICVEEIVVPYVGERRLATTRNVQEIKQAFHACQLTALATPPSEWRIHAFLTCLALSAVQATVSIVYGLPLLAIVGAVAAAVGTTLFCTSRRPVPRAYSVPYVPHLVSSVMAEYDRGTNATAARSTLRQKIRRLASLPLPDEDALKFIAGSELVCEQLLSHEDFFWEGAACFRQPQ